MLSVRNLSASFHTRAGIVRAVRNVSFDVAPGETLGIVGESGSGKSVTCYSMMGLIPMPPGRIESGSAMLDGTDLLQCSEKELRFIRGRRISMIFQDPMTALNPLMTVGDQIAEVVSLHEHCSKKESMNKAMQMLEMVGIPAERYVEYPHQFSGGMKQRVVIAIALACNPELLLADEPTTALDVTIQAQVMDMIADLQKKLNTAMILITHDLGIVAEACDQVAVIYAGEIVELASKEELFLHPTHPYTVGLFGSIPSLSEDVERLTPIPGLPANPEALPEGCHFNPRCTHCTAACRAGQVPFVQVAPDHFVRCHLCAGKAE